MSRQVIDRPDLQSLAQKYGFGSLTILLWVVYLYLWLPLVSVLAWLLGAGLFYHHVIERGGLGMLAADIRRYGIVILLMVTTYLSWAGMNYFRFRHSRRNTRLEAIDSHMLAQHFQIDEADVQKLQNSRVVEMLHDDDGNVISVRSIAVRRRARPTPALGFWSRRGRRGIDQTRGPGRGGSSSYSRRRLAFQR